MYVSASSNYYDCSHIEHSRDVFYRVLKPLALRARGFKPDKTLSLVY